MIAYAYTLKYIEGFSFKNNLDIPDLQKIGENNF